MPQSPQYCIQGIKGQPELHRLGMHFGGNYTKLESPSIPQTESCTYPGHPPHQMGPETVRILAPHRQMCVWGLELPFCPRD